MEEQQALPTVEHVVLQPQTVVATLNESTSWADKRVLYFEGQFTLEDGGPITAGQLLGYDRQGQLTWAYDGLREWVSSLEASGSRAGTVGMEDSSIAPGHKTCGSCGMGMPVATPRCPRCGVEVPIAHAYMYSAWWARMLATWLDLALVVTATALVLLPFMGRDRTGNVVSLFGIDEPAAGSIVSVICVSALFVYFVAMEATLGRTAGKMVFRAQVLTVNERRIGWGRSVVRNVFKMLALGGSLITLCCIVLSKRSQRIGDMVAGTIVVKDVAVKLQRVNEGLRIEVPARRETAQATAATSLSDAPALAESESESQHVQPREAPVAPRRGVAGFVFSLVGFIMPILWPIGLALSWRNIRREKRERQPHGLSLAGMILSAAGTAIAAGVLIVFLFGVPMPLRSSTPDASEEVAVREAVPSIQAAIEAWAADHGGTYPPPSKVSYSSLMDYADSWPLNPYTSLFMARGSGPGDFYYKRTSSSYQLTGYGQEGRPVIVVP